MALVHTLESIVDKEAGKEKERCLRAGSSTSTLTKQQREGRKSLLSREESGELVIQGTDKSGKRAVMRSLSPNGPLADLFSELLTPFIEAADSEERTDVVST